MPFQNLSILFVMAFTVPDHHCQVLLHVKYSKGAVLFKSIFAGYVLELAFQTKVKKIEVARLNETQQSRRIMLH